MLLSTHSHLKWDIAAQCHNLFVDFKDDFLFEGPDRTFQEVKVGLPYPVTDPIQNVFSEDPFKQLLINKRQHINKLKTVKTKKLLDKIQEMNLKNCEDEYVYMNRELLEFYKCKDPDDSFNNDYNIFCTGGVLDVIIYNQEKYLFWPILSGPIRVVNLKNPIKYMDLSFMPKSMIYGLKSFSFNGEIFILLREKSEVNLLELLEDFQCIKIYQRQFQTAVIDAKLGLNKRHLGFVEIGKKSILEFSVINMKNNKLFLTYRSKSKSTEYECMQFEFWVDSKVILMENYLVHIFNYKTQTCLKTLDPHLLPCNSLCNLKIFKNSVFLVSRHYLIKTDLDTFSEVSTYAHTLDSAPFSLDVVETSTDSYLCVANHSEKILFAGRSLFSLPVIVPSLDASLKEVLLRHADVTLIDKLDKRLNYSLSGLKLVSSDHKLYIYFVNSVGDLFRQEITDSIQDNKSSCEVFYDWIKKWNPPKPTLHVTNFSEMGDAFFFLARTLRKSSIKLEEENKSDRDNTQKFLKKFKSTYSKENVKSTFAKGFLEIWEDSDENSEEEDIRNEDEPEVPYYDKVNDWMEKSEDLKIEETTFENIKRDIDFDF